MKMIDSVYIRQWNVILVGGDPVKSVRLEKALEARLEEAARISGETVSNIIRKAVQEHCENFLGQRLDSRLADVTGVIRSEGGRARRTGKAFTEVLQNRQGVKS